MDNAGDFILIVYSIASCSVVCILAYLNFRPQIRDLRERLRIPALRYLIYPRLIRHRHFGYWSRADVMMQAIYLGVNVLCICYKATSISSTGLRAANLALIHVAVLYSTLSLGLVTNILGLKRVIARYLHVWVGAMVLILLAWHALAIAVSGKPVSLSKPENMWAVIVRSARQEPPTWLYTDADVLQAVSSLAILSLLSHQFLRDRCYEIFLRLHQALGILTAYGIWMHLAPQPLLPRVYNYFAVGICGVNALILCLLMLYRNGIFRRGFPRATLTSSKNSVLVHVAPPFPVKVRAGQYVSLRLWSPSISFWSFAQSHPFVVTSWSDEPQGTLDLFIEPRQGLTRQLLQRSQAHSDPCIALISGPYGISVPAGEFAVVVMVASGYGIAAHLPYLKQLMYEYNSRRVRTRRIHLVWQLETPGMSPSPFVPRHRTHILRNCRGGGEPTQ